MNGILLIDKPETWTSHDVVAKLRGALGEKRIGHSGTLDPMATGLLVVFLGRATRAVEFAEADAKTYLAKLRLGIKTDTQDTTGTVLEEKQVDITMEQLEAAFTKFTGDIDQIPPMYSAVKIGGKKLYELARKGKEVERKSRRVTIFELSCLGMTDNDYEMKIRCSKGTYIRTLCSDIGEHLGCGACMSALQRTEAGAFSLKNAHTLDEVLAAADRGEAQRLLLPTDTIFSQFEKITLTQQQERRVRDGVAFSLGLPEGSYRSYSQGGEFLAISYLKDGVLRTIKSFYEV